MEAPSGGAPTGLQRLAPPTAPGRPDRGGEALAVGSKGHLHAPGRTADAARADVAGGHVAGRSFHIDPCPGLERAGWVEYARQWGVPDGASLRRSGGNPAHCLAGVFEPSEPEPLTTHGDRDGPGVKAGPVAEMGGHPAHARPQPQEGESGSWPSRVDR